MELCKSGKNRSCKNTTIIQVSVYKTSIDILSYMKLVELNILPSVSFPTISKNKDPQIDVTFRKNKLGKKYIIWYST